MLNYILNLIFPPKCIFCGELLSINADINICTQCYKKIPFISSDYLEKSRNLLGEEYCDAVICLCQYTGIIKESIKRYKFFNKSSYYRTFGKLISEKVKNMTEYLEFDIIMCVPLHRDREKTRGYNQSYLISKVLGQELGLKEASRLLERTVNTHSQSLLDRNQRYGNIKGVFKVTNPDEIKGKRILLVDDVLTTGSTLNECSRILKESGACKVVAAVIASGRKY